MSLFGRIAVRFGILIVLVVGQMALSKPSAALAAETCQECMNQLNACVASCGTIEPFKALCASACVRDYEACSENCTQ
jgi:hypothetical protein